MSAIEHFVKGEIWYPLWFSPVLISIEVSFILLTSLELGLGFGDIEVRRILKTQPKRKAMEFFYLRNAIRYCKKDTQVIYIPSYI